MPAALVLGVFTALTKVGAGYWAARHNGVAPAGRWRAGAALVARGEFSIVIAGLGVGMEPRLGPMAAAYVLLLAIGADYFAAGQVINLQDQPLRSTRVASIWRWPKTTRRGWSRPLEAQPSAEGVIFSTTSLWNTTCRPLSECRRFGMKKSRIRTGFVAAALTLMGMAFTASPAKAQSHWSIGIGVGPGYYAPPPVVYAPRPMYAPVAPYPGYVWTDGYYSPYGGWVNGFWGPRYGYGYRGYEGGYGYRRGFVGGHGFGGGRFEGGRGFRGREFGYGR